MTDLFTPYLMTALLWKRLTTEKIIKNAPSLIHNAVKDNSFGVSGPCPPQEPLPTAPHLRQRPGTLPGQRSETQASRSLRQNKRPPIESPASFSAGSDELARGRRLTLVSCECLGTSLRVKLGLETDLTKVLPRLVEQ